MPHGRLSYPTLGVLLVALTRFDVTSCYFPITFNPPPNDPNGITKEGLVEGLRESMASNVLFAPFCMELLLDKVTSPVNATKAQCFLTLAACTQQYGYRGVADILSRIYISVRVEL